MAELSLWWPLVCVAFMRPLGIMLFLPVLNQANMGGTLVRNSFALMATIPILPLLVSSAIPDPLVSPSGFFVLLVTELTIGMCMGFLAAIPFWAIDMSGFIIDTVRGASMGAIFNPQLGEQSTPFGLLFSQILSALFFITGGFHAVLSALYQSYETIPLGIDWQLSKQYVPFFKAQWHMLYTLALMFSMPALVIMVLTDLAMGLLNRSAQQLNVFSLAMPIKSLFALLLLILSMQFAFEPFIAQFEQFKGDVHVLFSLVDLYK